MCHPFEVKMLNRPQQLVSSYTERKHGGPKSEKDQSHDGLSRGKLVVTSQYGMNFNWGPMLCGSMSGGRF